MNKKITSLVDIQHFCGEPIFSRGLQYYRQGMIRKPYKYENGIGSQCHGSIGLPYTVEIVFHSLLNCSIKSIHCSCPTEHYYACKHVAAILINWHYHPEHFQQKQEFEIILKVYPL